ncbi:nucleolar complex protein 2 homolog [Uloborus diversus]|uniref:nucleolar complex protein 2 homolog n=1 Tax=Uloborus diversus TaxID=327109 RepID=UPI0024093822|nr:nucleolar complex protein 2 homolog [Uloborus diversus]
MSDSDAEGDYATAHSDALKRLKSKDPEFYDFLKENDEELLKFGESDDESDTRESEDDEQTTSKSSKTVLSAAKLKFIGENIKTSPSKKLVKELINAFKTIIHQIDNSNDKVDLSNNDLFNDVMKLCLVDLVPALYSILKLPADSKNVDVTKSKAWYKTKTVVKQYLIDVLKMLAALKEPSGLVLFLKHIVHLVPFYSKFMKLCRLLLKKMITMWCCEEETVRVLSLIIVVRASKRLPKEYMGQILKHMYFSYVKNTKFTSPNTWPMINFMKRSLTEVYSLYPEAAYEHAFIYIRQLAIHLRNAITIKKQEAYQTVYNWQYIHCLLLWAHVLCRLYDQEAVKTLVYPLVQTVTGTITLIPTSKYIPLRIHLVKALIQMSEKINVFIPTIPFILEILTLSDYNKKMSFSVKPQDFSCSLKVGKSKLSEAAFQDSCMSEVNSLLLEYFKVYSHTIGFPELALPAVLQIKLFIKKCKVAKYNQLLKGLLTKIEENSAMITEKRRSVSFQITDVDKIKQWERNIQEQGTPILKFYKEQNKETVDSSPSKKAKCE